MEYPIYKNDTENMELFQKSNKQSPPDTIEDIEKRLKKRYLDRLVIRVRKIRKLLIEKNWEELKRECGQLGNSLENFGFERITDLSAVAHDTIPSNKVPRAATPLRAKAAVEMLIQEIDSTLMEYGISTNA